MMLVAGIAAFIISAPFTILGIETVSDIMGFLAFLLIFTYILREIFSYRNQLKNK